MRRTRLSRELQAWYLYFVLYSVIGWCRGRELARSSDGVVPYWSSHLPKGEEFVVCSGHSVQDKKQTAALLRTLLRDYLKSLGIH